MVDGILAVGLQLGASRSSRLAGPTRPRGTCWCSALPARCGSASPVPEPGYCTASRYVAGGSGYLDGGCRVCPAQVHDHRRRYRPSPGCSHRVLGPGWSEDIVLVAAYLIAVLPAPAGVSGAVLSRTYVPFDQDEEGEVAPDRIPGISPPPDQAVRVRYGYCRYCRTCHART